MRGKYSPTVNAAYMKDQEWWNKYSGSDKPSVEYIQYDPDGYDSYGYDSKEMDRAGNYEYEYYSDDDHDGGNIKYNIAVDEWGFDGTKPQARYEPVVAEDVLVADEVFLGKVVRDGRVAILMSPGYGAGWSTWNQPDAKEILFDPVIVGYVEDEKWGELGTYMAMRYPDVYTGGMMSLEIAWLKEGTVFRITEYDGNETIEYKDNDGWFVA